LLIIRTDLENQDVLRVKEMKTKQADSRNQFFVSLRRKGGSSLKIKQPNAILDQKTILA
jgi:hypothetical protein